MLTNGPTGGLASPPKHWMNPSVLSPQTWPLLTIKLAKVALGAPGLLQPQHTTLPSIFNPQADSPVVTTSTKAPAGGLWTLHALLPQQTMVPSVFTPQLWPVVDDTRENVPVGSSVTPELLSPQQTTLSSFFTPQM